MNAVRASSERMRNNRKVKWKEKVQLFSPFNILIISISTFNVSIVHWKQLPDSRWNFIDSRQLSEVWGKYGNAINREFAIEMHAELLESEAVIQILSWIFIECGFNNYRICMSRRS